MICSRNVGVHLSVNAQGEIPVRRDLPRRSNVGVGGSEKVHPWRMWKFWGAGSLSCFSFITNSFPISIDRSLRRTNVDTEAR